MKRAILFLNLGGPETLADVKPFLYRLFVDPEIIRIRFTPLRMFVAWLIATTREKKSQELYKEVGGGSPIRRLTDDQAREVERLLREKGRDVVVRTAFSCSVPLIEDVIKDLKAQGVTKFMSLPLYPQYSFTTTKGALERVRKAVGHVNEIMSYPDHPLFIKAHVDLIQAGLGAFSTTNQNDIFLLFSAHSIPEKLVTELGDPYRDQMQQTVASVVNKLDWKGPHDLAWQSKLGPVKWLEPATVDRVKELGKSGVKRLIVVPIAFVTDHIETLEELDIDLRQDAKESGIEEFYRVPGLNNHPAFMECLTELALSQTDFWKD